MSKSRIICLLSLLFTGAAATQPAPEPFDHFRQATVSLGLEQVDKAGKVFMTAGSGVIVSNGPTACLVTARHMFDDPKSNWHPPALVMRIPPPAAGRKDDTRIPLQLTRGQVALWRAPADGADIAVIHLSIAALNSLGRAVHVIMLADFGAPDDIFQGANVLALGYPSLLGEDFLSTPIARGGIISWDDPATPADKPFLVDANLFPGNSGGPVFQLKYGLQRGNSMIYTGKASLVGIVSKGPQQHVKVTLGGKPITSTNVVTGQVDFAEAVVSGVGGIGIIEPIFRIKPLLDECLAQPG